MSEPFLEAFHMPADPTPEADPNRAREAFWKFYVVPSAKGLEAFFWNLAWFFLLVCIVFSFNPFRGCHHENRTAPAVGNPTVPEQPADQR
jgi:hypothetical protein